MRPRKDRLKGGLADDVCYRKFDQRQLKRGQKVEYEHTNDPAVAKEIAGDHLVENPKYYDDLEKMETNFEKRTRRQGKVFVPPYKRRDGTCVSGYMRKR